MFCQGTIATSSGTSPGKRAAELGGESHAGDGSKEQGREVLHIQPTWQVTTEERKQCFSCKNRAYLPLLDTDRYILSTVPFSIKQLLFKASTMPNTVNNTKHTPSI